MAPSEAATNEHTSAETEVDNKTSECEEGRLSNEQAQAILEQSTPDGAGPPLQDLPRRYSSFESSSPRPSSWRSPLISLWSQERCILTAAGCCSSTAVLVIRLVLDREPTAYLIHSVVVFLDMILIHIFTKSLWLSVTGELVTIIGFLTFHFTKETVYELFETTLLAALCSFHLIAARKKVKEERNDLREEVEELKHRGAILLRNIDKVQQVLADEDDLDGISDRTHDDVSEASSIESIEGGHHHHHHNAHTNNNNNHGEDQNELTEELLHAGRLHQWFGPLTTPDPPTGARIRWLGNTFFEYFLDGSAGVMYTSFLGLIIDELIRYGSDEKK